MMNTNILIVEDSMSVGNLLKKSITEELGFPATLVSSYAEADIITQNQRFALAILDYILPDAIDGQAIDLLLKRNIPSIVMTSKLPEEMHISTTAAGIIDVVIKEGSHTFEYILQLVDRIMKNHETGVLVVDDSSTVRMYVQQILNLYQFIVYLAEDGLEAIELLDKHDDIKLILTDYDMPNCNGFELTQRLRKKYSLNQLAIIGLSARNNNTIAVKFLKYGANDFIQKPFFNEQLLCRINLHLRIIESFSVMRNISLTDQLTGVKNRRYLVETAAIIHANSNRSQQPFCVVMADIDKFKKVNDTYGHDIGDVVLKTVAAILQESLRKSDIICRYGGEEFCLIVTNIHSEDAVSLCNDIRNKIAELVFDAKGIQFKVTMSFGLCTEILNSIEEMIKYADDKLYTAKKEGRNRVCS